MSDDRLEGVFVEAEMEAAATLAEARLARITEEGMAAGGHWGPDAERYGELCEAVVAFRYFAPGWWLPWIGRRPGL
jgi:hypothetical protein